MSKFEYKVIPTPRRPKRAKGVKGEPARFANVLTDAINEIAVDGWEFYKTETLPMDAKQGLFSKRTETFQSVMVFRKVISVSAVEPISAPSFSALDDAEDVGTTPPITAQEPEIEETPVEEVVEDVVEQIAPPEVSEEDIVQFDADNIDPLKKVIEENKSSDT